MTQTFSHKTKAFLTALCAMACVLTAQAQTYFDIYRYGKVVKRLDAAQIDSVDFGKTGTSFAVFNKNGERIYSATRRMVDSVTVRRVGDNESYPALNITSGYNDVNIKLDDESKVYTIDVTGSDPYVRTMLLDNDLPEDSCVFTFEYNCPAGINDFQVFFCPPTSEKNSIHAGSIPPSIGTEWRTFSMPIKQYREKYGWGEKNDFLRLDFGTISDVHLTLRRLRIRSFNAEEQRDQDVRDSIENAKKVLAANVKAYLDATYPSQVTLVDVKKDSITISGKCVEGETCLLADVAPWDDVTEEVRFDATVPIPAGEFTVTVPRIIRRDGMKYDRLLSKWAIVKVAGDRHVLASHARYADEVAPTYHAKAGVLKSKKGIAAGFGATYYQDFEDLQAHSITMNILLNGVISPTYSGGMTAYSYNGKTYYINMAFVNELDEITKAAYKKGVVVSGILLTPTGSVFNDPENNGGYYTMPKMTDVESTNLYAAALNFLARRYSSTTNGRIHHWIMHNEVDMGTTWTNMGDQPEMRFFDRYIKSMRMCYNIVRQYDQNASVLGSYTHNWNIAASEYSPRLMLEQNVKYSDKEGDFRWGVAYHPYPINLTRPQFWQNDVTNATFSNNTTYVTFYNPEVISEWMLDKKHFYKDGTKRILFFSEQGTNSPDYSDNSLQLQAAGAAWIWKKINKLDGIDAMQWHAWADNREEFGLRIGLRAFADGKFKDHDRKPVWYVWQAAGTDKEDEVFAPYLNVVGIANWDNIIKPVK